MKVRAPRGYQKDRQALERIAGWLVFNGCDCECDHSPDEHDPDCEQCLACRIDAELPRDLMPDSSVLEDLTP